MRNGPGHTIGLPDMVQFWTMQDKLQDQASPMKYNIT